MSMPIEWIESLFKRFLGVYGNRFTRMWEGLDIDSVKAQWADELGNIRPESVRYALDHLPESMPPTLLEFRRLCLQSPERTDNRLPPPKMDREQAAQRAKELKISVGGAVADGKDWARVILNRAAAGERLPVAHVRMARQALGAEA